MRLDRYICESLGITRSESKALLSKGRVTVNGAVVKKGDYQLKGTEEVIAGGKNAAPAAEYIYIMLNKPKGVVSAREDKRDVTVVDLLGDAFPRRQLFPAGRLDKTSTGFVLLTDDGALAHDLLAPGRHVPKTYHVLLDTPCTSQMVAGFAEGVTLADGQKMAPAELIPDEEDPLWATVVLHQGVYHQIKRMFGVFDAGVNELHRLAIGDVTLDETMKPGQWRELTAHELSLLKYRDQAN